MTYTNNIISILQQIIEQYNRFFLVVDKYFLSDDFMEQLSNKIIVKKEKYEGIILADYIKDAGKQTFNITEENIEEIRQIYYMYEFTDKLLMISRKYVSYGSLYNFVKAGLLDMDEYLKAITD